uniref:Uncharacterized AAA domain-containing protein ycf46 n=1 Tax=Helminthocladia australis TaxID=260093 RepID=A0A1G4NT81_9FLOR|nr:Hypothetical protein ycf46 [Helminthocladia australis]SCW21892.1 Hypothetical protein ycf46 [Helminthocladia australis]
MHFQTELELLVKSSCSLIYVFTYEEERLECIVEDLALNDMSQAVYSWDFIQGFKVDNHIYKDTQKNPVQALDFIESFSTTSDSIFILKDFHLFFSDISVVRKIRNLSSKLDLCNHVIVISGTEPEVPNQLKHLMQFLSLPLPTKYEINLELNRLVQVLDNTIDIEVIEIIANICQGLSISQIRKIISKILVFSNNVNDLFLQKIIKEKQKQISQTSLLEVGYSEVSLDDIGGIENLKIWLNKRHNSFSDICTNYGLPYPKGLLLLGIQGTGKSISAKAIANFWNLVLLRLDIGRLFAGIVGQSEANTRYLIQIVEASAPCVLWIDEIDKAFSTSLTYGDSGTNNRVLATLLTWLAEKNSPVFVVATANNISALPSEITRKGRFDEIFFLDLPSTDERKKIFQVHLKKVRPATWHRYNIDYLAKYSKLFSGAEIQQVVIEAMYTGFNQQRDFTSLDLLNAIDSIIPLAFADSTHIKHLQDLASLGKFRPA